LELRDFIVTPVIIILVYAVAYAVRLYASNADTRVYFFPAITLKIVGALALGFIYQFYYDGGDTFNYHTWGSRVIWEAFIDSPTTGFKLLAYGDGSSYAELYKYSYQIDFFHDPQSYTIVRIAAIFDLITFSSYSATAILFAAFSFIGMWMFFLTFYEQYPELHRYIALATFFIPSVFFWGSGLLKDTVTLGCLGISTYECYQIFIVKRKTFYNWILLLIALYLMYVIKVYILMTFLPAAIFWVFLSNLSSVRSLMLKMVLFPAVVTIAILLGYYAILKSGQDNEKYALGTIAQTAKITAYDIRYWTGRDAGSGYTLGELDGTFASMLRLAPQAINVSLFRPYLWEVKNPLMLLSAIESLFVLVFCIYVAITSNVRIFRAFRNPDVLFTTLFSLSFAFAVGVSTYNFGSLARYKIPLLPFFLVALVLIRYTLNKDKKLSEFDETE
jgi:hypothetical protein